MLFENNILHFVGMRHILDDELPRFSRGFHVNIPEMEHGRQNTRNFNGDILDPVESEFRNVPAEKPMLFHVDNFPVGHDPYVQIVIRPYYEEEHPAEQEPPGRNEDTKSKRFRTYRDTSKKRDA